ESALGPVAVENLRQPAPQPGDPGFDRAAAAGMDRAVPGVVLDAGRSRSDAGSRPDRLVGVAAAETRGCQVAPSPRRGPALGRRAPRAGGVHAGLPAVRSLAQPGCDPAHGGADADHAPAA